jgi:hypothetical protein
LCTLAVASAIDTIANAVMRLVPAHIGHLGFVSVARGQPAALRAAGSIGDALGTAWAGGTCIFDRTHKRDALAEQRATIKEPVPADRRERQARSRRTRSARRQ